MQRFIVMGRFTKAGFEGMLERPENREDSLIPFIEAAGARLVSYHKTTGDFDFHIIVESSSIEKMMALMTVTSASAGVCDLRTCLAFTGAEAKASLEAGQEFRARFRSAGA